MGTLHYHPCATCGGDVPCRGDYEPPDWSGLDICEFYHSPEVDSYLLCEDCERERRIYEIYELWKDDLYGDDDICDSDDEDPSVSD